MITTEILQDYLFYIVLTVLILAIGGLAWWHVEKEIRDMDRRDDHEAPRGPCFETLPCILDGGHEGDCWPSE